MWPFHLPTLPHNYGILNSARNAPHIVHAHWHCSWNSRLARAQGANQCIIGCIKPVTHSVKFAAFSKEFNQILIEWTVWCRNWLQFWGMTMHISWQPTMYSRWRVQYLILLVVSPKNKWKMWWSRRIVCCSPSKKCLNTEKRFSDAVGACNNVTSVFWSTK